MKTLFLRFPILGLVLLFASNAAAWEVKIVNNSNNDLKYEVYQQTLLMGEQVKCSGYLANDTTCKMDQANCPTRVNIWVNACCGRTFKSYQSLESGYLGAQCWNHRVEIKPVNPNTKDQNPPMTWVWSYY